MITTYWRHANEDEFRRRTTEVRYPEVDADIGLVEYYFVGDPKEVQPKISKGRPFVPKLPSVKKGMSKKITDLPDPPVPEVS